MVNYRKALLDGKTVFVNYRTLAMDMDLVDMDYLPELMTEARLRNQRLVRIPLDELIRSQPAFHPQLPRSLLSHPSVQGNLNELCSLQVVRRMPTSSELFARIATGELDLSLELVFRQHPLPNQLSHRMPGGNLIAALPRSTQVLIPLTRNLNGK